MTTKKKVLGAINFLKRISHRPIEERKALLIEWYGKNAKKNADVIAEALKQVEANA